MDPECNLRPSAALRGLSASVGAFPNLVGRRGLIGVSLAPGVSGVAEELQAGIQQLQRAGLHAVEILLRRAQKVASVSSMASDRLPLV